MGELRAALTEARTRQGKDELRLIGYQKADGSTSDYAFRIYDDAYMHLLLRSIERLHPDNRGSFYSDKVLASMPAFVENGEGIMDKVRKELQLVLEKQMVLKFDRIESGNIFWAGYSLDPKDPNGTCIRGVEKITSQQQEPTGHLKTPEQYLLAILPVSASKFQAALKPGKFEKIEVHYDLHDAVPPIDHGVRARPEG